MGASMKLKAKAELSEAWRALFSARWARSSGAGELGLVDSHELQARADKLSAVLTRSRMQTYAKWTATTGRPVSELHGRTGFFAARILGGRPRADAIGDAVERAEALLSALQEQWAVEDREETMRYAHWSPEHFEEYSKLKDAEDMAAAGPRAWSWWAKQRLAELGVKGT
jgi:hypothetical protein